MGADYPDWGGQYNNKLFFPSFDLAELAARLGSLVLHDRRGAVIWYDNFDDGLSSWTTSVDNASSIMALQTAVVEQQPFAVHMESAGGVGNTCSILRKFSIPYAGKIGLNVAWACSDEDSDIYLTLRFFTNSAAYEAEVQIDIAGGLMKIRTPAGYITVVTGLNFPVNVNAFLQTKVVFDNTTFKYERLVTMGQEYDISAYDLYLSASGNRNHVEIECRVENLAGASTAPLYIDGVVLTAAEPDNQ